MTASSLRGELAEGFVKGADVSWLPQMEAAGFKFYDRQGNPKDCLEILKDYGINTIRLRIWVNPPGGHSGCDEVVAMAKRVHQLGMRILIDFHYSDSWADPMKQNKPAAWANDDIYQLTQDIRHHTIAVLKVLIAHGVVPEWVQVGNEISNGMLWPEGRVDKESKNLSAFLEAGYEAVKSVDPKIKVIVHLNDGSNHQLYRRFFDVLAKNRVQYDVIGLSYYPYWQKGRPDFTTTIDELGANLADLAAQYHKEVMVVETGGEEIQPQNTAAMIAALIRKTREVPDGKGLGVIYWEPEGAAGWSRYKLSCWQSNGEPTAAMDGFLEGAKMKAASAN